MRVRVACSPGRGEGGSAGAGVDQSFTSVWRRELRPPRESCAALYVPRWINNRYTSGIGTRTGVQGTLHDRRGFQLLRFGF